MSSILIKSPNKDLCLLKKQPGQASKIKGTSKISFPVLVFLLLPSLLSPLCFPSSLSFLLGRWLHCVSIPCLKVSNSGFSPLSKSQPFVVPLQNSGHGLMPPVTLWSQSRPWFPARTNHHLVAVAGWWETIVGGGWRTLQTELM